MTASPVTVEERSKTLFGNLHMLTLCGWVGTADGVFSTADASEGAQVPESSAYRALQVLTSCDVITRLPRGAAERTQWYQRCDHSFWSAIQELLAGIEVPSEVAQ